MIAFKLYFKLLLKNISSVIMYLTIFMGIILMIMATNKPQNQDFSNSKTKVVIYDNDDTYLTNALINYLENYAEYVDIEKSEVDDAFFYRDVEYVVTIPKGFTESFTSSDPLEIEKRAIPDGMSGYFFESQITKYLNMAYTYLVNDLSTEEDLARDLNEVLESTADYVFPKEERGSYDFVLVFYNYLAYLIIALVVSVSGTIMLSFSETELKRRNSIGSISNKKLNIILISASMITGILLLLVFIGISLILFPNLVLIGPGPFMILNAFIYTIVIVCLGYLLTVIFKSKTVIQGMGTVLSLGIAFITGVFIPQSVMNKEVLLLGRIFPSFYFIEANDKLSTIVNFSFDNMKSVYIDYLIMLLFGLLFVVLSIIISNKKRQTEN